MLDEGNKKMHNILKFLDNGTNTGKPSIIAYETCGLHISPVCDTVVQSN